MTPTPEAQKLIQDICNERQFDPKSAREKMGDAKNHLRELSTEERETLLRKIREFQENINKDNLSNAEQDERGIVLHEIEKQINLIGEEAKRAPATLREDSPEAKAMQSAFDGFTQKFEEISRKIVSILPLPILKFLQAKLPEWMGSTFFGKIVEQKEIYLHMEEALGKEKVKQTDRDNEFQKTLREQYEKLPTDKKSTMTFQQFVMQKIRVAERQNRAEYTMQDLVNTELDIEKKDTKPNSERGKEKKKERAKRLSELAEKNPEVKNAIYTLALARALQDVTNNNFKINMKAMGRDLSGERAFEVTYEWKKLAAAIATWLEKENEGEKYLGVELDGGVLEETDGTNILYDTNIIPNFDLRGAPVNAIEKLRGLKFREGSNELLDGTDINGTARNALPKLQKSIERELAILMNGFAPEEAVENPAKEEQQPKASPPNPTPNPAPSPSTPPPQSPQQA